MPIFYQDSSVVLEIDETVPCILTRFLGYPRSSDHIRQILDISYQAACEYLRHHPKLHSLIDGKNAKTVLPEDVEWINKIHAKRMAELGVKYTAITTPRSVFAEISLEEIKDGFQAFHRVVRFFENVKQAREWLINC
jgi:hypothetical protein